MTKTRECILSFFSPWEFQDPSLLLRTWDFLSMYLEIDFLSVSVPFFQTLSSIYLLNLFLFYINNQNFLWQSTKGKRNF